MSYTRVRLNAFGGPEELTTPIALVRKWFEAVEAPRGKKMVVFGGSGHAPFK